MQFVTFLNSKKEERLGIVVAGEILDLQKHASMISLELPNCINAFLDDWESLIEQARKVEKHFTKSDLQLVEDKDKIQLLAAVPRPRSCRDAYAFRQHVETARKNRGLDMIPEFDQFPVFYFTNHNAIIGSGDLVVEKDHLDSLDFELEVAIVIGKHGKNISAENADDYIAGFMIMNDFSARTLQREEMRLHLGPAKGKDFATALGNIFVTVDELDKYKCKTPEGRIGNVYDLPMKASYNGNLISEGNLKDMNWTFAEIIERVSYGVEIYPGDVIGSGTVGTGCFLELNGTGFREAEAKGQSFEPCWLKPGDEIELEVSALGRLKNKIQLSDNNVSILEKKKQVGA